MDERFPDNPKGIAIIMIGIPGSGKSMAGKREIFHVYLATDDDIIICDPEGEYSPIVEELNGQEIRISSNSRNYINPLDISMNYAMAYAKRLDAARFF